MLNAPFGALKLPACCAVENTLLAPVKYNFARTISVAGTVEPFVLNVNSGLNGEDDPEVTTSICSIRLFAVFFCTLTRFGCVVVADTKFIGGGGTLTWKVSLTSAA